MTPEHKALKTLLQETFCVFEQVVEQHRPTLQFQEIGTVHTLGHGIARVYGLPSVGAEELVPFPGGLLGMVFNPDATEIGVIMLDASAHLSAGTAVRRPGRVLDVPVGERLLGRIVDATGRPLGDRGPVRTIQRRAVEQAIRQAVTAELPAVCARLHVGDKLSEEDRQALLRVAQDALNGLHEEVPDANA